MTARRARPPRRRHRVLSAVVVAVLLLVCACSSEEQFTREDLAASFTEVGYSEAMAGCMADGLIEEFGLETMTEGRESSEMSEADRAKYGDVLNGCVEEVGIDNVGTGAILEGLDCSFLLDDEERAHCESVATESGATDFLDMLEESDEQPLPTAPATTSAG